MPVPLLDLRAQHAAIRDEVLPALEALVDSQLFILGAPVERLEREVAELLALGFDVPDICDELGITANTVQNHLKQAQKRLGIRGGRARLTAFLVFGVTDIHCR